MKRSNLEKSSMKPAIRKSRRCKYCGLRWNRPAELSRHEPSCARHLRHALARRASSEDGDLEEERVVEVEERSTYEEDEEIEVCRERGNEEEGAGDEHLLSSEARRLAHFIFDCDGGKGLSLKDIRQLMQTLPQECDFRRVWPITPRSFLADYDARKEAALQLSGPGAWRKLD